MAESVLQMKIFSIKNSFALIPQVVQRLSTDFSSYYQPLAFFTTFSGIGPDSLLLIFSQGGVWGGKAFAYSNLLPRICRAAPV